MKKRLIIISSFVLLVIGFSYVLRQKYVDNIQDDNDSIIAIEKKLKEKYTSVIRNGEGTVDEPYYFEVEQNGKKGICDGQGNEVISPKYDRVSKKEGYYILKDSNVTSPKHDLGPTEEKLYVLKDGKTTALKHISKPCWYLVMLDGKNGACDSTGRLIIPPVYENLDYAGVYYTVFNGITFRINLSNPTGVAQDIYNNHPEFGQALKALAQALEIARRTKDSTIVRKAREDLRRTRNYHKPEPLKVPEWFGEEIKTPIKTKKVSQNNKIKSTNVQQVKESVDTKTNSRTKDNNGLLYSGTYTISGEEYNRERKEYNSSVWGDSYVDIKIYEEYLTITYEDGRSEKISRIYWGLIEDEFQKKIGKDFARGKKLYYSEIKTDGFFSWVDLYYVESNYNMGIIQFGYSGKKHSTSDIMMAKGRKEMPRHHNEKSSEIDTFMLKMLGIEY
jgi:hypothetical protein